MSALRRPVGLYACACGQTLTSVPAEHLECCSLAGVPRGWRRLTTEAEPELPDAAFPFRITWRGRVSGVVLHELDVAERGPVIVPGADQWAEPVNVELDYADGHHEVYP